MKHGWVDQIYIIFHAINEKLKQENQNQFGRKSKPVWDNNLC